MNETGWRHAYQASLSKVILAKGEPVEPNDSYYGWVDYDLLWHLKGRKDYGGNLPDGPCEIIVTDASVYENRIDEFAGTDASGDHYQVAELRHCECACGARKDFTMRYKGSLGDVLAAIEILDDADLTVEVVPQDELDARVSIATDAVRSKFTELQSAIRLLSETYAEKAADGSLPNASAHILELVSFDLLNALKRSEKP